MIEDTLKRIEQKLIPIESRIEGLSSHLRLAFTCRQKDPQSALTKCRILLEKLLRDIYQREFGCMPKATMVGPLLSDKGMRTKITRRMHAKMTAILEMGNLGAHGDEVLPIDAERTLLDLLEVIDWYFDRYFWQAEFITDRFYMGRELLPAFREKLRYPFSSDVASVRLIKTREDVYLQITRRYIGHDPASRIPPSRGETTEVTKRYNLLSALLSRNFPEFRIGLVSNVWAAAVP